MKKVEAVYIIEHGLWHRILSALESAAYCDHVEVTEVLKEISDAENARS